MTKVTVVPTSAKTLLNAPDVPIVTAIQQAVLTGDHLPGVVLDALQRKLPDLPISEIVVDGRDLLTIDGPSTFTLSLNDPGWLIEKSGLLDKNDDGRLDTLEIIVDGLRWRLTKTGRSPWDTLNLTFEQISFAVMREFDKHLVGSRGNFTRAEFLGIMVHEPNNPQLGYFSPERGHIEPIHSPDYPVTKPAGRKSGFDKDVHLNVGGSKATTPQLRELATALGVADQHGLATTSAARVAMVFAAIAESRAGATPDTFIPNKYGCAGVFQAKQPFAKGVHDTEAQARGFLEGTGPFRGGGAIKLMNGGTTNPVEIAVRVEVPSNWPDDAYAQERGFDEPGAVREAKLICGAWNAGNADANHQVVRVKSFHYSRGLPGKKETSVDCMIRLAGEVAWRVFSTGNVVWFVSDDYLISQPAPFVIDGIHTPGLMEPPTYDEDHNKPADEIEIRLNSQVWGIIQGQVIALRNMGPLNGRWLVHTIDQSRLDHTDCTVTLIKPQAPQAEPAPELITVNSENIGHAPDGSGASAAIKWAASKIGFYREEFGPNRGKHLDFLEGTFGFPNGGEPWCAMFATTALTHGGVNAECRSDYVPTIRAWANAGTHGYLRVTTKPAAGHLFMLGGQHTGIVEKVDGDIIHTIEGNEGDVVTRNTRGASSVDYAVPRYPKVA